MTTKLNLTINEKTAKAIKTYAEKRKTSVSRLAEEYFKRLAEDEIQSESEQQSFVEKYAGIATGKLKNIDTIKDDYLKEKHGL